MQETGTTNEKQAELKDEIDRRLCTPPSDTEKLSWIAVNLYPFCEFFINNAGKIQKFQLRLSLNKNKFET